MKRVYRGTSWWEGKEITPTNLVGKSFTTSKEIAIRFAHSSAENWGGVPTLVTAKLPSSWGEAPLSQWKKEEQEVILFTPPIIMSIQTV